MRYLALKFRSNDPVSRRRLAWGAVAAIPLAALMRSFLLPHCQHVSSQTYKYYMFAYGDIGDNSENHTIKMGRGVLLVNGREVQPEHWDQPNAQGRWAERIS